MSNDYEQNELSEKPQNSRRWGRRLCIGFAAVILAWFFIGMLFNPGKGEMSGAELSTEMMAVDADDIDLLFDTTGWHDGRRHVNQAIMPRLFDMIRRAEDTIIIDMFLVNHFGDLPEQSHEAIDITHALIRALVEKKQKSPEIFILFITDPINSVYAPVCPAAFKPLAAIGGSVVLTDLHQLPDSNLVYSPFYRAVRPFFNRLTFMHKPVFTNPFERDKEDAGKITAAQFARLLNFKANHRKTALIRNEEGEWEALITSSNPHTASSLHGNIAVHLRNGPLSEMVRSEYLLARASILSRPDYCFGGLSATELTREIERRLQTLTPRPQPRHPVDNPVAVQYLTESRIGNKLDWMIEGAEWGDTLTMMMFYLSDPGVLNRLLAAGERGVRIRILLDPNKDAFGLKKGGIPNRVTVRKLQAAAEAGDIDLQIRWFDTRGEQAHYKAVRVNNHETGKDQILAGSANFTRRNLRGYNLEANLYLENAADAGRKFGTFFEKAWSNSGGITYSTDADTYYLKGWRYALGRIKTFFGTRLGIGTY